MARHLRFEERCHYIIALSHLGYRYDFEKIDDRKFARLSRDVDLILGGHTHTFMAQPEVLPNQDNKRVTINQVGWAGILLGPLDIHFESNRKGHCITCQNRWIR